MPPRPRTQDSPRPVAPLDSGAAYGCAVSVTVAVAEWPSLVYSIETVSPGFLVKVSSCS